MPNLSKHSASVKVIGANGQISLGKQFAGRQVLVEEQEAGVWLIRTATVVPDKKRWLVDDPSAMADLKKAVEWGQENPPKSSNTDELLAKWSAEG